MAVSPPLLAECLTGPMLREVREISREGGSPKTETGLHKGGPEPSESSVRDQKVYFTVAMKRSSLKLVGVVKSSLSLSQ